METYTVRAATTEPYELAEGPVWDVASQRLVWVDIPAGRILSGRLDGLTLTDLREVTVPGTVGAAVPAGDGRFLVAAGLGFALVGRDGTVERGPQPIPAEPLSRMNDGACDPAGRFLAGSLSLSGRTGEQCLYRLEPDGTVSVLAEGITLSNGLGWRPDGAELYHVDSDPGVVWAQPYDVATAAVGERRELFHVEDGVPDGLAVDVEGHLWIAIWEAGQVRRYSPDGALGAVVEVPAPHTSSVSFAGPGLDTLVITTARAELSEARLREWPGSGLLYTARVGVTGLPSTPWRPSRFRT